MLLNTKISFFQKVVISPISTVSNYAHSIKILFYLISLPLVYHLENMTGLFISACVPFFPSYRLGCFGGVSRVGMFLSLCEINPNN